MTIRFFCKKLLGSLALVYFGPQMITQFHPLLRWVNVSIRIHVCAVDSFMCSLVKSETSECTAVTIFNFEKRGLK
jgi:hypothetical protein